MHPGFKTIDMKAGRNIFLPGLRDLYVCGRRVGTFIGSVTFFSPISGAVCMRGSTATNRFFCFFSEIDLILI